MPEHAKPSPWRDAWYWARAYAGHLRDEVSGAWGRAWWSEVATVVAFLLVLAFAGVEAVLQDRFTQWATFLALAAFLGVLLRYMVETGRDRERVEHLLAKQPTGAPRVVNIQCDQGRHHRFIYGPRGWAEAGPAVLKETS